MLLPSDIGYTNKFHSFYGEQERIIFSLLSSPSPFLILKAPPGIGKTLIYTSLAILRDERALFLTSTKAHGDQLISDMSQVGMISIEGHNNYSCYHPNEYCQSGYCKYQAKLKLAEKSRFVSTNYAHSITLSNQGLHNKMGYFGTLICDEAHRCHDILCSLSAINIPLDTLKLFLPSVPASGESIENLIQWARKIRFILEEKIKETTLVLPPSISKSSIVDAVHRLANISVNEQSNWRKSNPSNHSSNSSNRSNFLSLSPIWGTKLAHRSLFCGIKKVVLVSATFTENDRELLGIPPDQCEWFNIDSPFKSSNRPFIFISDSPIIRNNFRMKESEKSHLIKRMDKILFLYPHHKGLCHTRSYEWVRKVNEQSKYSHLMIYNEKSDELAGAFEQFKLSSPPSLLTSPSVTEGFDFPGHDAEFQFLLKVPYLNKKESEILRIRCEENPEYEIWEIIKAIEQAYGRIYRSHLCYGETYMLDGGWIDFVKKHSSKFQRYFRDAWKNMTIDKVRPLWIGKERKRGIK